MLKGDMPEKEKDQGWYIRPMTEWKREFCRKKFVRIEERICRVDCYVTENKHPSLTADNSYES
jgi:hypothetical protein